MKSKIGIYAFFLTMLFVGMFILHPASADVSLLPNGVQQFFDNNGNPLSSGTVTTYSAGTNTLKVTYKDSLGTIPNTNPIILDAGGKAIIYGSGTYRQVVKDRNLNLIWDAVTAPGGGGSTPTLVGDGNLVGTILPWSGLIAPNQYVFAFGQEITRASFPTFFTAVTQNLNVICTAGSNTLTGVVDTSQINIGAPVEVSLCVLGSPTVLSKTTSTVTLSGAATVNTNTIATFFPYGNGDGVSTFNVPDLRGRVLAGRDNMGGTAAARLSNPTYGTNSPDALGGTGGSQTTIVQFPQILVNQGSTLSGNSLATANVPTVQPTITLNYVIKVTPDTSLSVATGVAAINNMTGTISCGSGLICTGNIINTIVVSPTSLTLVGTSWGLTGGPCTVTCTLSTAITNPAFQYGNPVNLQINATANISALTLSIKTNSGVDPAANNPVLIPFRDATASNGNVVWNALIAPLSLTIPGGATLGTTNATPFRIWMAAVNDTGTTRLCVINTLSGTNIYPLGNNGQISSLGTPASATQTFYCGTIVSSKSYTILGYFSYESGLATAGTWVSIPNILQLYGPGIKLPGDIIQHSYQPITISVSTVNTLTGLTTAPTASNGGIYSSITITPSSAANRVRVKGVVQGTASTTTAVFLGFLTSTLSANALTICYTGPLFAGGTTWANCLFSWEGLVNTTSPLTFNGYFGSNTGSSFLNTINTPGQNLGGTSTSFLEVDEIQR